MSDYLETEAPDQSPWKALSQPVRNAFSKAWGNGVPSLACALYGRWWQLESWLRSLIYLELRSKVGSMWSDALGKTPEFRQVDETAFRHMVTPDAHNKLAYANASTLFRITLDHWDLFEPALLVKSVWTGRIDELLAIRNRIGHCRRPHSDDLTRLEQTLRDLEVGAFAALCAFNDRSLAKKSWTDLVSDGWLRCRHDTAERLIEHAQRQYGTIFRLECSRRPWTKPLGDCPTISGMPGFVWHASWHFTDGRQVQLDKFWRGIEVCRDLVLFACADSPSSLSVAFSAVEDPSLVSNAIGYCFDAALMTLGLHGGGLDYTTWTARYADIDYRLQVGTPWASVESSMEGLSIFGA